MRDQPLLTVGTHRHDQPPAVAELLEQRGRHGHRRRRDEDAVVRRVRRPPSKPSPWREQCNTLLIRRSRSARRARSCSAAMRSTLYTVVTSGASTAVW